MVCDGTISMLLYRFYRKRRPIYNSKTDQAWEETILNN